MFGLWEAFENSIALMKDCLATLRKDPELVCFPLLSGMASIAVTGSFLWPLRGTPWSPLTLLDENGTGAATLSREPLAWLILFLYYFANYFVICFFNSALVACVVVRAHGGNPNVWTGIRFAIHRAFQIAAWACVAGTVGLLIRTLETEKRVGSKLTSAVLGIAWSLATFFVVPVMVVEKIGPFAAIRRSLSVLRETWGELLVTGLSMGPVKCVCFAISIAPVYLTTFLDSDSVFRAGLGLTTALLLLTILVFTTLESIFLAALYLYASDGRITPGFDEERLGYAFAPRSEA
ncbi:MAG: DUF6159 family protein [Planctomycetota bacterium]